MSWLPRKFLQKTCATIGARFAARWTTTCFFVFARLHRAPRWRIYHSSELLRNVDEPVSYSMVHGSLDPDPLNNPASKFIADRMVSDNQVHRFPQRWHESDVRFLHSCVSGTWIGVHGVRGRHYMTMTTELSWLAIAPPDFLKLLFLYWQRWQMIPMRCRS